MGESGAFIVTLGCEVQADIVEVFDAFTRPEDLSKWFTTSSQIDLRVGGKYSTADHDKGEYLVVERPSRLRFTWENEEHCPGTIVDLLFRITGVGTRVDLEHFQIMDQGGYEDMREGWSWALDSLKSFFESGIPISFEEWKNRTESE
jgi:uncharacterized protein YndB with AHSA1/START domain